MLIAWTTAVVLFTVLNQWHSSTLPSFTDLRWDLSVRREMERSQGNNAHSDNWSKQKVCWPWTPNQILRTRDANCLILCLTSTYSVRQTHFWSDFISQPSKCWFPTNIWGGWRLCYSLQHFLSAKQERWSREDYRGALELWVSHGPLRGHDPRHLLSSRTLWQHDRFHRLHSRSQRCLHQA